MSNVGVIKYSFIKSIQKICSGVNIEPYLIPSGKYVVSNEYIRKVAKDLMINIYIYDEDNKYICYHHGIDLCIILLHLSKDKIYYIVDKNIISVPDISKCINLYQEDIKIEMNHEMNHEIKLPDEIKSQDEIKHSDEINPEIKNSKKLMRLKLEELQNLCISKNISIISGITNKRLKKAELVALL